MDIISHTLTGIAVGTVVASLSKASLKKKLGIVLIGGLGGALPDIDAFSYWSKFDTTIGDFLNLEHTGRQIYGGKFWYSHHAALHSVLAPLLIVVFYALIQFVKNKNFNFLVSKKYGLGAFFFGFLFHLFEDMPTPASVWGGVNLFFPSSQYIGGYGKIWWWNNYDLVLIIFSVIVLNSFVNLIKLIPNQFKITCCLLFFSLGIGAYLYQINTRPVDFSYSGRTTKYQEFELQSKQIQKEILGENLFDIMVYIDSKIPLNF